MKSFKQVLLAVFTSLLLTAGLARAAQSFDVVSTSSQMTPADVPLPAGSCVIILR